MCDHNHSGTMYVHNITGTYILCTVYVYSLIQRRVSITSNALFALNWKYFEHIYFKHTYILLEQKK